MRASAILLQNENKHKFVTWFCLCVASSWAIDQFLNALNCPHTHNDNFHGTLSFFAAQNTMAS